MLGGETGLGMARLRRHPQNGCAAAARCGTARSGISLAAAVVSLAGLPQQRDVIGRPFFRTGAEFRPRGHQPASLLE